MKTTCEHCVFAKKEDGIQTGCELQYLDIFKNRGMTTFAEEKHYEINNTFCPGCRNIYWLENHKKEDIINELKLAYTAIIINNGDSSLYEIIDKLSKMDSPPKKIIVSLLKFSASNANKLFNELKDKYKDTTFLIDNWMMDDDHKLRVKSGVKKTTTPYFVCISPHEHLDLEFINNENKAFQKLENEWFKYTEYAFLCNTVIYKNFMNNENPVKDMLEFVKKVRDKSAS